MHFSVKYQRRRNILKIACFDCFSGISGDMCLGALIDAGVSIKRLVRELKKLPVKGYEVRTRRVKRATVAATKVDVMIEPKSKEHGAKRWEDIENIIHKSSLSKGIKEKGLKVFRRLFETEAKIHGEGFRKVHLHELGAVDCLIDIFGTIIGFNILKVEKIYSSPVNLGSGFIKTEHGILPVPAPASAETLKGIPLYSTDSNFELTTPTGAALVRELPSEFGDLPLMNIETIGLGAGSRNFKDRPNVLRLFVGTLSSIPLIRLNPPIPSLEKLNPSIPPLEKGGKGGFKKGSEEGFEEGAQEEIIETKMRGLSDEIATVIETNIDDMNPQIYEYVMEKLFQAGALDVFVTQVIMKKGRPGIKLTVLCKETEREEIIKIILTETTTIGLRFYEVKRRILNRLIKVVDTEFGKVRVKFSSLGDEIQKAIPEYEDCKRIARNLNLPLVEVMKRIRIP
jgi:uncharacterized protein (TIGR00299 family) protein